MAGTTIRARTDCHNCALVTRKFTACRNAEDRWKGNQETRHFQIEVNIAYNFIGWGYNISPPRNIFKIVALAEAFFSEN
jgi:hypothetical protein